MIVFDASGSMAGNVGLGVGTTGSRGLIKRDAPSPGFAERHPISPRGSHHLWSRPLPTVQRQA